MEGAARTDRASKGSKPFVLSIILRSLKKGSYSIRFFQPFAKLGVIIKKVEKISGRPRSIFFFYRIRALLAII